MKTEYDPEFRFRPEREYFPGKEFGHAPEQAAPAKEDTDPAPAIPVSFEYNENADTTAEKPEDKHKRLKQLLLKPIVAITATLAVATAAGGYSILSGDSVVSSGSSSYFDPDDPAYMEYLYQQAAMEWSSMTSIDVPKVKDNYYVIESSIYIEMADTQFPTLTNLEPNGYIPGYGVIDEDWILLQYNTGSEYVSQYIWAGEGFGYYVDNTFHRYDMADIPGVRYDRATNTLTLDHYKSSVTLIANIMGNGFKINLVGENQLEGVLVWGFHYGGSVTFTGDGSLTVTKDGIHLRAEMSESSVMIDKGVKLDITNEIDSAIVIDGRTPGGVGKGVYYLEPLKMTEGVYRNFATPYKGDGTYDPDKGILWLLLTDDEDGHSRPANHVVIE